MKKWTKRLLRAVLFLFLLANVMAFFHARKFTHFDPGAVAATDPSKVSLLRKLGILFTGVSLPRPRTRCLPDRPYTAVTLDASIACWYLPAAATTAKGTIILCHGYGGEKSGMLDRAYCFLDAGYNVLLPDFRGAGGSAGNTCTIGYKEAEEVKACVAYLVRRQEGPIFLMGSSMGAAAIMRACSLDSLPVKALILECPFGTLRQAVQNRFEMVKVPSFPLADLLVFWGGAQHGFNAFRHNPKSYARQIRLPVLLLYGGKDDRVKREETSQIYDNLAGPKQMVCYPGAGHESYLNRYREQWKQDVFSFLDRQL